MTYVSDILAGLLDAEGTRQRVRDECLSLLAPLPLEQQAQLRPLLEYYGGKCMGYPPIWAVARALELGEEEEEELVRQTRATLFANLTTSIVDDLFDRDEQVHAAHLGVLYLLMFGAIAAGQWTDDFAHPAQVAFSKALRSANQEKAAFGDPGIIRIRGERIGAFFGMTGEACVRALGLPRGTASDLVALLESFGVVCGHIDDVLDLHADLERGDVTNAAFLALGAREKGDPADWRKFGVTAAERSQLETFVTGEFEALARQAAEAGWTGLASRFRDGAERFFDFLPNDWNDPSPRSQPQPIAL